MHAQRLSWLTCALLLLMGIVFNPSLGSAQSMPALKTSYIFTTHHTPFMVAAARGEAFKDQGVWLKTVLDKQKYELVADGRTVAVLDLVVAKSGSESATLFAMKHIDVALASVTAMITAVDKGTPLKVLCPLQTEGMALVAPAGSTLNNWEAFVDAAKAARQPLKIGYHSPTSAPKIVFEGALREAGLEVTENPNDYKAKVLMVDLKETGNMLPALAAKQVEAIVGPSPFPEVAITRGVGQVVADLRDLPPVGKWHDYPCCVIAARDEISAAHPEVVGKFVELMIKVNAWCNQNRVEAGILAANWIGIPEQAGRASQLVFLTGFSQSWMTNTGNYLKILDQMNKFNGQLKGKSLEQAKPILFDTSFVDALKL